ncbi:MAG: hypothetical protein HQ478_15340 [Chloroflexi bacterium]|nr:hypothetical protein [Chloroflexota bacterium]
MRFLMLFLGIFAALVLTIDRPANVSADGVPPDSRHLIALDTFAVGRSINDESVARSSIRNIANAAPGVDITLMRYGTTPGGFFRFEYDSPSLAEGIIEFESLMGPTTLSGNGDQFRAIAASFDYLSDIEAPSGSRLTLITSDGMDEAANSARGRLLSLVELFITQNWTIDVLMLPSASQDSRAFLTEVSERTNGVAYDMGDIGGLSSFIASTNGLNIEPVVQTRLSRGAEALASLEIPPLTDRVTISVARDSASTQVDVFDPRGAVLLSLRPDTTITETELSVIFEVTEPEAGQWIARASGSESSVLIGAELSNGLHIAFDELTVPVDEPVLLSATVLDGEDSAVLSGAFIEATLSSPSGSSVHILRDSGTAGDQIEGDGIYSALAPEFKNQVTSGVELVLRWENLDAEITGQATLKAEYFPTLQVNGVSPGPVDLGDEVRVAEIAISKAEFPYPVSADSLTVDVLSPDRRPLSSKIIAVDGDSDGLSWNFQILAVPTATGQHSVVAALSDSYLDRPFGVSESVSAIDIGIILPPVILPVPEETFMEQIPGWAWALAGLAIAVSLLFAVKRVLEAIHPVPYGYLYDDSGRMLFDFRRARLSWIKRTFSRNRVPTSALPEFAVEGGEFIFTQNGAQLRTREEVPNLRVNGRPAGTMTKLVDQIRLGIGGRLITFKLKRPTLDSLSPQPGD